MDRKKLGKPSKNFIDLLVNFEPPYGRKPDYIGEDGSYSYIGDSSYDYRITPEEMDWATKRGHTTLQDILYRRTIEKLKQYKKEGGGALWVGPPPKRK